MALVPFTQLEVHQLVQIEDRLEISYYLENTPPDSYFLVNALVFTPAGNDIAISKITGDFGKVKGGSGERTIKIYLQKTALNLSTELYVKLYGEQIVNPRSPFFTKERTQRLLKSAVWPSWGTEKQGTKKSLLLLSGIISYSAMGGAVYFNRKASDHYDAYVAAETIAARNDFDQKAKDSRNISRVLGYSGASIWMGCILWNVFEKPATTEEKPLSLVPTVRLPWIGGSTKFINAWKG